MKREVLLIGIMLFFFNTPVLPAGSIDKITVCWESGLKPPYLMLSQSGKPTGIAVDMVEEIAKRNHIGVKHIVQPWKRCLSGIKSGGIDVVPNSSNKKTRREFAYFSKPLYKTELMLYYSKNRFPVPPKITSVEDLKKYKVGGVLGFNYSWYDGILQIDQGAKTREMLIAKLRKQRIDFAIAQKSVISMMERRGDIDLKGLGNVPEPEKPFKNYHILISKKLPERDAKYLVEVFDIGIDDLGSDGETKKIMQQYLGSS